MLNPDHFISTISVKQTHSVHEQHLQCPRTASVCTDSQAEQQGEAGDVLVPLGSEKLHVNVLDGGRVVGHVHLLRHAVLPHLSERICAQTPLQYRDRSHTEAQPGR